MRLNRHLLFRLCALAVVAVAGCAVMTAATPKKKKAPAKKTAAVRIPALVNEVGGGYYYITASTLPLKGTAFPDFENIDKKRLLDSNGEPVSPWSTLYGHFSWDAPEQSIVGFTDGYVYYLNPDLTVKKKVSSDEYFDKQHTGSVFKDGKLAIVNEQGQRVTGYIYDDVGEPSEGFVAAVKGEKAGIVDMRGDVVVPFVYDYAEYWGDDDGDPLPMHVHNGVSAACLNDNWGVIDMKGNVVIPFEYSWIDVGSKGTIRANKNDTNYYFDSKGNRLRTDKYSCSCTDPDAETIVISALVSGTDDYKFGYMTADGTVFIKPQYDFARPFAGPTALVKQNGAWHLIDRTGKIVKRNVGKWMMDELAG